MKLKTRLQCQRDARWGSILLGYNTDTQYSIYNYGCLITSLANYIDKQPNEVNQILKDNSGFVSGGNFVWAKSTCLGITQTYVSSRCSAIPLYATEVAKLREFIKQGYPALCEVDFNPATDAEEMHFVLAVGCTDTEILIVDPWEGQLETWTDSAFQRNTYQYRIYDKKLSEDGGIPMVSVEGPVFENLVRKSSTYDLVLVKLNVNDSETVVIGELDKLISYEDAVVQKDHQITEIQKRATELENQLIEKSKQLEEMKTNNLALQDQIVVMTDELTVTANEHQQTIQNMDKELKDAQKAIQELKQASGSAPVFTGWRKYIYKFLLI